MRRRRSPIAVDFGEHTVKVLQLEQTPAGLVVRDASAALVRHTPDLPSRRDRMIEAGRRALRGRAFRGGQAVVALRLADVATRHVRVPAEQLKDAGTYIGKQVQEQDTSGRALSICPIPIVDLFDHGEQRREFLCCTAPDDTIQDVITMTEALGLRPEAIDLQPCAQARTALHHLPNESFVHVDLGHDSARFVIVRAGDTMMMRSVPLGGGQLAQGIEDRLQLDIASVFDLGSSQPHSTALHEALVQAVAEPLELLLRRVADGIRYCGALFHGRTVTSVRVSGGLARLPGLVPYVGRRIGITAEVADPFHHIDCRHLDLRSNRLRPDFTTAMGLALGGLPA